MREFSWTVQRKLSMAKVLEYSLQGPELGKVACKAKAEEFIEPEKMVHLGPC